MTDVARMKFKSVKSPAESGALVLSDDGTFRVDPSDAFRDEMARLEESAVHRSQTLGIVLGAVLITLGALALGIGWYCGRVFGTLGRSLGEPRPVEDVLISRDAGGGVRVTLRGLESRLQTVQMAWHGDEILAPEAEAFLAKFAEMRGGKNS